MRWGCGEGGCLNGGAGVGAGLFPTLAQGVGRSEVRI